MTMTQCKLCFSIVSYRQTSRAASSLRPRDSSIPPQHTTAIKNTLHFYDLFDLLTKTMIFPLMVSHKEASGLNTALFTTSLKFL